MGIDSAATHTSEVGSPPAYRGQNCMEKHGVPMNHFARQVPKEACHIDEMLCMGESNLRDWTRRSHQVNNSKATLNYLGAMTPRSSSLLRTCYGDECGDECGAEAVPGSVRGAAGRRPTSRPPQPRVTSVAQGQCWYLRPPAVSYLRNNWGWKSVVVFGK